MASLSSSSKYSKPSTFDPVAASAQRMATQISSPLCVFVCTRVYKTKNKTKVTRIGTWRHRMQSYSSSGWSGRPQRLTWRRRFICSIPSLYPLLSMHLRCRKHQPKFFLKKGLSEAQQQCLRWTLRVSYRDQKSTAGLPHVPSVTLCLSGVCTLEITFYASCAEDIRKTCCSMCRMAKCLVCVIGRVEFGGQGVGRLCLPFCKSTPLCVKSVLFVLCYLSMSLCLYVCITSFQKTALQHCIIALV